MIVIARGGGSVEDLLPFSNETLVRAVSAVRTPVVSAIGHESDVPLLDHVADLAASTPTDAAKRIVPDLADELRAVADLQAPEPLGGAPPRDPRDGADGRPAAAPAGVVRDRIAHELADTALLRDRARRRVRSLVDSARSDLDHVHARIRTLSPQATLDRGYAVVRRADGTVVRAPAEALGTLHVRVAGGEFEALVP